MPAVTIDEIALADRPASWAALGFAVSGDTCQLGTVRLRFDGSQPGGEDGGEARTGGQARTAGDAPSSAGILGWSLRGIDSAELDGLATTISHGSLPAEAPVHANGALAIDHIVAVSPAFERTVAALQAAGLDLRRIREQPTPAGAPRQAFFRLGREILELVQEPDEVVQRAGGPDRPARFWGLALLLEDLDRIAASLAPHLSEVRAAVQPGRRIATVRRSAGLGVPLALMSTDEREGARAGERAAEHAHLLAGGEGERAREPAPAQVGGGEELR